MSADTRVLRMPSARDALSPFGALLLVYFAYFGVVYTRVYEYAYFELMQLGTRIIGFVPRALTLLVYVYGALTLLCGFAGGVVLARRPVRAGMAWASRLRDRVRGLPVVGRIGPMFSLAALGWAAGLVATVTQVGVSGGASILDIATRWEQDPKIVLVAATQIFFVPMLLVSARARWQKALAWSALAVSVAGLGLLGARNLPAKLVVSAFLAIGFVMPPKRFARFAVVGFVLLVLVLGVVGAVTKAGIYGPAASANLALALGYSDSVGTVHNLDRIVHMTPSTGLYGGRLAVDGILSTIPGVNVDYANYTLGEYLGGRSTLVIGGQTITRSVSLAPMLPGAAYADLGVLGVALQMLGIGFVMGYLQDRARQALWLVPFLVTLAAYVINGVNGGIHGPQPIIWLAAAVLAILFDLIVGRRLTPAVVEEG